MYKLVPFSIWSALRPQDSDFWNKGSALSPNVSPDRVLLRPQASYLLLHDLIWADPLSHYPQEKMILNQNSWGGKIAYCVT